MCQSTLKLITSFALDSQPKNRKMQALNENSCPLMFTNINNLELPHLCSSEKDSNEKLGLHRSSSLKCTMNCLRLSVKETVRSGSALESHDPL